MKCMQRVDNPSIPATAPMEVGSAATLASRHQTHYLVENMPVVSQLVHMRS